ncbi:acyl-phosphate:glycerol-3-phosphate O-acyltransferase [Methylophaga lonarensis MPL]|uniref:Glycerol-3-phosphate acyltransferase n=1 Tax=Methylophaga lonarensis MPL TaxID=1286106 RepID=M7PU57_9GAMM|nr:glycerol-3-phosphate 1-O-acyltransferase PlsY [Methylophaga lonarensis]EMR13999.1 acyl-phosphate:glycerol-3-phosphate O-acyltransferase [Methylophaga lonarensis MPL]
MPETAVLPLLLMLAAYLIGSLSSAVVLCKLAGLPDPRTQGSGNPGATNVLRMGSRKLAALVLVIDVLKGVIPVLIGRVFGLEFNELAIIALLAFTGHLYPVFFQFKGGKGVATALGAFLALAPMLALLALLTWVIVFAISRISSLSAISAAIMAPVYSLWLLPEALARYVVLLIAVMLLWRHKANIQRLLAGQEKKAG